MPSLSARALTTLFRSVDRISWGIPVPRRREIPMPSSRLTRTNSSPSAFTKAWSSVWTPSKSITRASTSRPPARGAVAWSASARTTGQLFQRVNFDGVLGGHFLQLQPAEEAVLASQETLGPHGVERSGFAVLGRAVLPAGAHLGAVPDGGDGTAVVVHPVKRVALSDGKGNVGAALQHVQHGFIQMARIDERGGALQQNRDGRRPGQRCEHVEHRRFAAGGVAGEVRRTHHHAGAAAFGFGGDVRMIGADDDGGHRRRGQRTVDGAGHQAAAGHGLQVLERDPFGAAAGRDDDQDFLGVGVTHWSHGRKRR